MNSRNQDAAPAAPPALRMGPTEWAILLMLSVIWGASFFFYRVMVVEIPPLTIVLGRLTIAAVALHLFLRARGQTMRFPPKVWARFFALSLLNNVIPFTLIAYSETRISGGLAALLHGSVPMMTAVVAHFLTRDEKLRWNRAAGVVFGFLGVAVLVGPDAVAGLANANLVGELICLSAAVIYAFAGVYARTFSAIPPLQVATGQVTMGALAVFPASMIVDQPWTLAMPSVATWASLLTIALVGTSFAYIIFFRLVSKAGATNMSLVTLLQPTSAIFLGWIFLNEGISTHALAGMAVIAVGLGLIDGRPLRSVARLLGARNPAPSKS